MVGQVNNPYVGIGVYGLSDASRLSGVSSSRIKRWLCGYQYQDANAQSHTSAPVWDGQIEPIDSRVALGFRDLMEVRFVDAFIREGVSLQAIRKAMKRAQDVFNIQHPFCSNTFLTDGRTIFVEVGKELEEPELLDLVRNQFAFNKILKPYIKGLEFDDDELARWWPLGLRKRVVVDPVRSFGTPIVAPEGVPTDILYAALKREKSIAAVMQWFDVSRESVIDARNFEERMIA